jgi:hypothetical protein
MSDSQPNCTISNDAPHFAGERGMILSIYPSFYTIPYYIIVQFQNGITESFRTTNIIPDKSIQNSVLRGIDMRLAQDIEDIKHFEVPVSDIAWAVRDE